MITLPKLRTFYCPNHHPILVGPGIDDPGKCYRCDAQASEIKKYERDQNSMSYSMMKTFGTCARLAWFEYELGLLPEDADTGALDCGTLIHTGLAKWYGEPATTKKKDKLEMAVEAIKKQYYESGLNRALPEVAGKYERRALDVVLGVFVEYIKHYLDERMVICKDASGKHLTEINFAWRLTLPGDTAEEVERRPILRGVIDGIYEWNGVIYVVDHKTTSLLDQGALAKLRVSDQLTTYIWGIREILQLDIRNAMVNVIGLFKKVEPDRHFVRITTQRNSAAIAAWKVSTLRKWQRYLYNREHGLWDRETEACGQFRRPCGFIDPCEGHEGAEDNGLFIQKMMGKSKVNVRKLEEIKATVGED
jgi:PD-(D/E)XK nuclease superfamily